MSRKRERTAPPGGYPHVLTYADMHGGVNQIQALFCGWCDGLRPPRDTLPRGMTFEACPQCGGTFDKGGE